MTNRAVVLDTPEQIRGYQTLVVIKGLEAIKIGMRLNRSYTPTNLMRTAHNITGKKFKTRDYEAAIAALVATLPAALQEAHWDRVEARQKRSEKVAVVAALASRNAPHEA